MIKRAFFEKARFILHAVCCKINCVVLKLITVGEYTLKSTMGNLIFKDGHI